MRKALDWKFVVLELVLQGVVDQVDEVRRFHRLRRALGHGERRFDGQGVIAVVDEAVGAHQAEHDVAAVLGMVGMAERIEVGRPARQAGQLRGFGQGDLAEVLAEKRFGGLAESANAEGSRDSPGRSGWQ